MIRPLNQPWPDRLPAADGASGRGSCRALSQRLHGDAMPELTPGG
jgi:hypothetical protein